MEKKREKQKRKKGRSALRVFLQYIFLWPSLRTYFSIWFGYKHRDKKKKKEKVVIIED